MLSEFTKKVAAASMAAVMCFSMAWPVYAEETATPETAMSETVEENTASAEEENTPSFNGYDPETGIYSPDYTWSEDGWYDDVASQTIFEALNRGREEAGLKPLTYRYDMQYAVDTRANQLADGCDSFWLPDGKNPWWRVMIDYGYISYEDYYYLDANLAGVKWSADGIADTTKNIWDDDFQYSGVVISVWNPSFDIDKDISAKADAKSYVLIFFVSNYMPDYEASAFDYPDPRPLNNEVTIGINYYDSDDSGTYQIDAGLAMEGKPLGELLTLTPENNKQKFAGWVDENGNAVTADTIAQVPSDGSYMIKLYAKWEDASKPTATPAPTVKPSPAPTTKPTATPAPTTKPTATPKPTTKPTATPKPTTKPTATPKPTTKPTATPKPTTKPTATPKPTPKPTATPKPTPTPAPSPQPTTKPTATPKPTTKPTATPKPTTKPTATPKPNYGTGVDGFVTRLYGVCLGRKPDAAGKANWVNQLKSGQISGATAAYGFVFSNEFKGKNYCNTDYVKQLYRAFMRREYDSAGLRDWVNQLSSGKTREEVFNGFSQSAEFKKICASYGITVGSPIAIPTYGTVPTGSCSVCGAQDGVTGFVTRLYQICLDRKPDSAGLKDWSNQLWNHTNSGRGVAYGFIFSKEFQAKNYNNSSYIEYLYKAFLGRSSDPAGKADWLNRMAQGWTREQVFDGFVGSQEFTKICQSYGIVRG